MDTTGDIIIDLLRHWARVQPDAPAILAKDAAPLSYKALVALLKERGRQEYL